MTSGLEGVRGLVGKLWVLADQLVKLGDERLTSEIWRIRSIAADIEAALPTPPAAARGDVRIIARDIHYAIMDDGLAPLSNADNHKVREAILRVLQAALAAEGVQAGEVEQRARELLAAEWEVEGYPEAAKMLRAGWTLADEDAVAIRAIVAALPQQPEARVYQCSRTFPMGYDSHLHGLVTDNVASALLCCGIDHLPAGVLDTIASEIVRGYHNAQPPAEAQAQGGGNCWSCGKLYTLKQRGDADGNCPSCGAEIELDAQQHGQAVAVVHSSGVAVGLGVVEWNDKPLPEGTVLYAAPPPSVPDGWVLVPVEPTEVMWESGKHFCDGHVTRTIQTYRAMLAAAQPQLEGGGECWSCGKPYTFAARSRADGNCPSCGVEIELDTAPPSAPVGVVEALIELVDLMQGVIDGEYTPDSFTLQPARAALAQQPAAVDDARRVMHELCDCPNGRAEHAEWCAALTEARNVR